MEIMYVKAAGIADIHFVYVAENGFIKTIQPQTILEKSFVKIVMAKGMLCVRRADVK
jgi:hypothetical protein